MTDALPKTILAPTATSAERAIDRANAKTLEALPVNLIRWVKNPDLCPVELLPWLAWEYSVDTWNTDWTEQEKRDAIKRAPFIHRHRGTVAAVRRALVDSPFGTDIIQWFEQTPPGDPYTFRLNVEQKDLAVSMLDHEDLKHAVMRAKNLRSWFSVHVFGRKEGVVYGAGYLLASEVITTRIFASQIILNPTELIMSPGKSSVVDVVVLPAGASDLSFTVTSSDESIVTVEIVNGKLVVNSHAQGSVTITVESVSKTATATLPVTVASVVDVSIRITDPTAQLFWLADPTETISVSVDGADMPVTVDSTGRVFASNTLTTGDHRVRIAGSNTITFYKSGISAINRVTEIHQFDGNRSSMAEVFRNQAILKTIDAGAFDGLSGVTAFDSAFYGCTSLTDLPAYLFTAQASVTSMTLAFYGCSGLKTLPDGLLDPLVNVLSYESTFSNCLTLASLPAGLFYGSPLVTNFSGVFAGCPKLTTVPADTFSAAGNATTFFAAFSACRGLTTIPAGLFSACAKVTDYSSVFATCTGLKTVPEDLFAGSPASEKFFQAFSASGLTQIPSGLFAKNVKAQNFSYVFYLCKSLAAVPAGLFDACSEAINFQSAFSNCELLASLPGALFANTHAQTMTGLFSSCYSLVTIPADLFSGCQYVTSFANGLAFCDSLTAIPSGLLDDMVSVLNISGAFQYCTSVSGIPTGLFDSLSLVTNASDLFANSGLIEVPGSLFYLSPQLNNISGMFENCDNLVTVPGDILAGAVSISNASYLFANCSDLPGINNGVFLEGINGLDNISMMFASCVSFGGFEAISDTCFAPITNGKGAFKNCRSLIMNPSDIFRFDIYPIATDVSEIFSGCSSIFGQATPLIDKFTAATSTADAFYGCVALDDYQSIPASWL